MSFESFKFKSVSKTITDDSEVETTLQRIVNALADILGRIMPREKRARIESLFNEASSLPEILVHIETMALSIGDSLGRLLLDGAVDGPAQSTAAEQGYANLERLVQKYEAEIRDHIRMEQQLGIYTQNLEEEIDALKLAAGRGSMDRNSEQIGELRAELERLRSEKSGLERQVRRQTRGEVAGSNTSVLGKNKARSSDKVG